LAGPSAGAGIAPPSCSPSTTPTIRCSAKWQFGSLIHLGTVAGVVVPVRGANGAPVAVWDLDSTERIEPGDVRAMDVLFASLARTVAFDRAHFQR